MSFVNILKSLGPVKIILLFLFLLLPALEFADGSLDLADLYAGFLVLLLLNDIFISNISFVLKANIYFPQSEAKLTNFSYAIESAEEINYKGRIKVLSNFLYRDINALLLKEYFVKRDSWWARRIRLNSDPGLKNQTIRRMELVKTFMNFLFMTLFLLPDGMEFFGVREILQERFFYLGMMVWSVVLLIFSYRDYQKTIKKLNFVYAQIAFLVFIGSLFSL